MNRSSQTIAANSMAENGVYQFSVTITPQNPAAGDTRTATKTIVLTAKNNDAPSLLVRDVG